MSGLVSFPQGSKPASHESLFVQVYGVGRYARKHCMRVTLTGTVDEPAERAGVAKKYSRL